MRVASCNLARGLSDADRVSRIYDGIARLDADLVFLPEAFDKSGQPVDPDFAQHLGYSPLSVEYGDTEVHPSGNQYILALSRVAASLDTMRLGSRNAITATTEIEGEEVAITGAHFDDRQEDIRLDMVNAFLVGRNPDVANVLVGDLNSMHGGDLRARILSSSAARTCAATLKNDRRRSLATRLTGMASGDIMRRLEDAGFRDADPRHRPTMLMGVFAVAQLDHFMHDEKLRVTSFRAETLKCTDHKAISGEIELA